MQDLPDNFTASFSSETRSILDHVRNFRGRSPCILLGGECSDGHRIVAAEQTGLPVGPVHGASLELRLAQATPDLLALKPVRRIVPLESARG